MIVNLLFTHCLACCIFNKFKSLKIKNACLVCDGGVMGAIYLLDKKNTL